MLEMRQSTLNDTAAWDALAVKLPTYDREAVTAQTKATPTWVHFGAGNIFRGFVAVLQQQLLNNGDASTGIIAADTFDYDIINKVFAPFDNLTMAVTLNADGTTNREIVGSIVESLCADSSDAVAMARFTEIFTAQSLQMVSVTITEKGYALTRTDGSYLPVVAADIADGPTKARHVMSMIAALLWTRFNAGALPIAIVSMDNCSHNGEKLQASVLRLAKEWAEKGFVGADFIAYLSDATKVSFPWTMIDKITPRPHEMVRKLLASDGIANMEPFVTSKNTYVAGFVNAERPQYLVIEDSFPNGRPALEKAGAYLTDRETVNNTERMKVTTCLNPLHTAMAPYGCLLNYGLVSEAMKDPELVALVKRLGYVEGLPVVIDPKIIDPKAFIDEVINERLPNPFMPDEPCRLATDISQKMGIRFGETMISYFNQSTTDGLKSLVALPLGIAGWLRYLLGVDDNGAPMEISSDPLLEELQAQLSTVEFGNPASYHGQLKKILGNRSIFNIDYTENSVGGKIERMFVELIAGKGAVRATLQKYLTE